MFYNFFASSEAKKLRLFLNNEKKKYVQKDQNQKAYTTTIPSKY
jgi:hypothetical protein